MQYPIQLVLFLLLPLLSTGHPNELACGQLSESIAGGKIIMAGLPKKVALSDAQFILKRLKPNASDTKGNWTAYTIKQALGFEMVLEADSGPLKGSSDCSGNCDTTNQPADCICPKYCVSGHQRQLYAMGTAMIPTPATPPPCAETGCTFYIGPGSTSLLVGISRGSVVEYTNVSLLSNSVSSRGSSTPPLPIWGGSKSYTVTVKLTAHDVVKAGASWLFNYSYSSGLHNVSRYDHAYGQQDEVCHGIKHTVIEPCSTIHATDGWMYIAFPTLSSCCKCTQNIGPVRSDWLQDGGGSYVGIDNVDGFVVNEWLKQGASDNHYYQQNGSAMPVRYMEHKNGLIKQWDFNTTTYKKGAEMEVFAPPPSCQNRCLAAICLL